MIDIKKHLLVGTLVCGLVFFCSVLSVHAQTPSPSELPIAQDFSGDGIIQLDGPLVLPNEAVTLTGTGEPQATVFLTVSRQNTVLFRQSTKVDQNGKWAVPLPAFAEPPDELTVRTEVQLTPLKAIEVVGVTTAVSANALVIFQLIAERFFRLLQVFGLLRPRKTRGFVFDVRTKKPVPFALLTIENILTSISSKTPQFKETVVSDVDGFFTSLELPTGEYKVTVAHPEFRFPVTIKRPWYSPMTEFYKGEALEQKKQQQLEVIFIPLEARTLTNEVSPLRHWLNFKVLTTLYSQVAEKLFLPMAVLSFFLMMVYPGFLNFAMFSFYVILWIYSFMTNFRYKKLQGTVKDQNGKGISEAVVRIYQTDPYELTTALLTNQRGQFSTRLPTNLYQVTVTKDGMMPKVKGMTYEGVDLKKAQTALVYDLVPVPKNPFQAL